MRVLLIEPDSVLVATYTAALQQAGHIVDAVATAQRALIAADDHCPDIVVMEHQLSGTNGIGFLQEFRSYSDWREVPVVIHTNMPQHKYQQASQLVSQEYGVVRWLYKPRTNLSELCGIVAQYGIKKGLA